MNKRVFVQNYVLAKRAAGCATGIKKIVEMAEGAWNQMTKNGYGDIILDKVPKVTFVFDNFHKDQTVEYWESELSLSHHGHKSCVGVRQGFQEDVIFGKNSKVIERVEQALASAIFFRKEDPTGYYNMHGYPLDKVKRDEARRSVSIYEVNKET